MARVKTMMTAVLSAVMGWLGILAVPVFLMVGSNVVDYITGLIAAKHRNDDINSYKGIWGIVKKVCMWLLVVIGAWVDILIQYTAECAGIGIHVPFIVATVVAVWIVVNEIISILENMIDIGVTMPPFLMPIVRHIRQQIEEAADFEEADHKEAEGE